MNDFKATVRAFLIDPARSDVRFRMNSANVCLMKAHYDEETDFIYMVSCCGNGDALQIDCRPEFAGIYSLTQDKVICPSYYFGFCCDDAEKQEDFGKKIAARVEQRIIGLVNNLPVPVPENAPSFDSHGEYYCERGAHEEALRWYFNEALPHDYAPLVDPVEWLDTRHLVMALNHPDECIEELAVAFIRHYAQRINNRLEELKLVREEYAKLLENKGNHYFQRKIIQAVENKEMKTVQLEILREGKPFTTKYDAAVLRNSSCRAYSTWYMPGASRIAYESLFGRLSDIQPCDIKRITYGRKIIYEAEENV